VPAEISQLLNAYRLWRQSGIQGVQEKLRWKQAYKDEKKALRGLQEDYRKWVAMYDTITPVDREAIIARISQLAYQPRISVIVPVYNVAERWLRLALDSVTRQLYTKWELCIADDSSDKHHIRKVLEEYAAGDERIRVTFRKARGHISAASNSALQLASGEFIALLDHDDELTEHALYMIVEELNAFADADLIYSDEDKINGNGERTTPHFKPDWNPDLFRSYNCISHLGVYRTELVRQLGGFREGYEGSQDYDLAFRVIERIPEKHIRHIPHVLYHWREVTGSAGAKKSTHKTAEKAIQSHFDRRGIDAIVTAGFGSTYRVTYPIPAPAPLVSLIVANRDRSGRSHDAMALAGETDYQPLELIVLENECIDSATLNRAARRAKGDLLCFMLAELKAGSPGWLKEMVSQAIRPEVGAVGPKLCSDNGTVQHAGIIAGLNGLVGVAHRNVPRRWAGYFARSQVVQNYSAVSGACLLTRRRLFLDVGGLNEVDLPLTFSDVDFCFRLREKGYRIVWTPFAELYCSATSDGSFRDGAQIREMQFMKSRWGDWLLEDPYYNKNLTLDSEGFALASPPRTKAPWRKA
jgi:GT2 family glycosyltransferase